MTIDILMALLMPLLMAYSLIGENTHEVLGLIIFALFVAHNVLNRKWWTSLTKGKYTLSRIIYTVVNLLLAIYMILQPLSGIMISKFILKGVTIKGTASLFRTVHMTSAYWGFILLSFHLGLHINTFVNMLKKYLDKYLKSALMVIFVLIAAYGVHAFISRNIGDYMLMKVRFAFFDTSESRVLFFVDYLAVMVLVSEIGYWLRKIIIRNEKKQYEIQQSR